MTNSGEEINKKIVDDIKVRCLFSVMDKCTSMYGKGIECNGVKVPKKCYYNKEV